MKFTENDWERKRKHKYSVFTKKSRFDFLDNFNRN